MNDEPVIDPHALRPQINVMWHEYGGLIQMIGMETPKTDQFQI